MFGQKQQARTKAIVALCGVVALAVVVGGAIVCSKIILRRPRIVEPTASTYQAVFLANGQLYFGHLKGVGTPQLVLEDVFYLQANQQQAAAPAPRGLTTSSVIESEPQPAFALMKLGKVELHGPEDRIFINKEQMLFWENLRADSQVVKTIAEYQKQGN